MSARRALIAGLLAAGLLVAAGCSNDSGSSSSGGGDKGTVHLSGQNFTEMQIMAAMYTDLLEKAGYSVDAKLVTTRDVYIKQLQSGGVDVVPEYAGALADYLNTTQNGPNAKSVTSPDPQATLAALKPLADKANITMLEPAKASDQNAFAVTKAYATKYHLSTLSDLAGLKKPIVLAADPDCPGRTDCQAGLSKVYGIDITKVLPLGYGSPQTIDSLKKGESQLGEVASTQSNVDEEGLVILKDDKSIQPAQNLIPAVNTDFLAKNKDVATALNKLAGVLTTSDLTSLSVKVDIDRDDPAQVATDYLKSKGLE